MESRTSKQSLADVLRNGLVVKGADLIRSLDDREKPISFVTQCDALDHLQGEGLKPGSLIEIVGSGTSGRLSLELMAIAAATHAGDAAAFLDCAGQFDPQQANRSGVNLERLLWLAPRNVIQALLSAELLLQAGFFLVSIDLGLENKLHTLSNAVWLRLARVAQEHKAIILVSSSKPLNSLASDAILYSEGTHAEWDGAENAPQLLSLVTHQLRLRARRGLHRETITSLSLQV